MDLNSYLLIGLISLMFVSWLGRASGGANRLGAVERKLDLILQNLGIDPHQGLVSRLMDLLKTGQKIEAIKLYREITGQGLKEAKDYVERL